YAASQLHHPPHLPPQRRPPSSRYLRFSRARRGRSHVGPSSGAPRHASPVLAGRSAVSQQVPEARREGVHQDLPGRRHRLRHHGRRRLRREADSHPYQPNPRRWRVSDRSVSESAALRNGREAGSGANVYIMMASRWDGIRELESRAKSTIQNHTT
ncbi:hypothetical protein TPAR_03542, partial [Tolypocladium paradoxum]